MLTLLILFSLTLHGVAFLIIRSQSVKMNQVQEKAVELRNQSNEMEELLSTYLYEIREENDRFLAMMKSNQTLPAMKSVKPKKIVLDAYKKDVKASSNSVSNLDEKNTQPIEVTAEKTPEISPFEQALALYKNGDSTDSIAKKLNCGKTEVELMLKFRRKSNIMP